MLRPSPGLRRCALTLVLLAFLIAPAAAQPPLGPTPAEFFATDDRLTRLEQWVIAAADHQPGEPDQYSRALSQWNLTDLQALWVDLNAMARLMRDRSLGTFHVETRNRFWTRVVYSRRQMQALQRLACVAGGSLDASGAAMPVGSVRRECVGAFPVNTLPDSLKDVALWYGRERVRRGDDNLVWRRGALLHSDVAMLETPVLTQVGSESLPFGPKRFRRELLDGQTGAVTLTGIHWSLAEAAVGFVTPSGAAKPAPGQDPWVRSWYEATVTWMQGTDQHDEEHLNAALSLFPADSRLWFLAGCEHEAYASPAIQVALDGARDAGRLGTARDELRRARDAFVRSIEATPDNPEAHLHLGRVLTLLGDAEEAIPHLTAPHDTLPSIRLRYFNRMFLGAGLERVQRFSDAADAYDDAARLFPRAQSPLLARSALARRRDAYEPARDAVARLWALAPGADDDDPWWAYSVAHASGADALVTSVWEAVR
ncbi:MAG: hypothetical protein JSU08_06790 [Acidobacteria bacterium]|nr:hypothetical protein [Acidobacteriota bacterium]